MKLASPKIPLRVGLEPADIADCVGEATLERVSIANADVTGLVAASLGFDSALLERVQFTEARLEKFGLTDCIVKGCDFSAAYCVESSFIRVHISGGRMIGIDLSRSTVRDVTFEGCKLSMTNFRFSKFVRVQFIDCILTEADFQASELTNVTFEKCQIEQVEFGQCRMKDVDLRTSELTDLRGWHYLKGVVIDSMQLAAVAPQLAGEFGLKIQD